MALEDKTPSSIGDVRRHLFKSVWIWTAKKPAWAKLVFVVTGAILLLIAARLDFFGEPFHRYAKLGLPIDVDPKPPVISLLLSYEIEDNFGRRTGKLGDTCYDGDHLYIAFKAGLSCWVSVFGVDSKDIYPVFRSTLEPSLIEHEQNYTLDFKLDKTIGNEIYYAIAAHKKFDFDEEIEPHLKSVFREGNSKGPSFSEYQLKLPDKFTQKFIYFKHLARQSTTK